MEELLKIGISDKTIKQMKELCPDIIELNNNEIIEKIELLKSINCNENQIKNIISSNPYYLDRSNMDIEKLTNKLLELGFENLSILFESNPYILNLDAFEIDKYIKDRENAGEKLENIVEEMDADPSIFQEI